MYRPRHRPPALPRLCASKPARALHTGPSDTLHTGPSGALHAGGAWCPVGEPQLCLVFGTKFSLLSFLVVRTGQNSPCTWKKRQIEPFRVNRESFVPHIRCEGVCWESFVPKRRGVVLVGRDLFRRGTFRVCSCRASYTHRRPSLALGPCSTLDTGGGGGFAALEAGWLRVAGVSYL